jgi:hypothetical protein
MVGRELEVRSGELWGKKGKQAPSRIAPAAIISVREYGFNNPFLQVEAHGQKYRLRAWDRQYDEIVDFVEQHTEFRLRRKLVYRVNRLLFRTSLSALLRGIFRWRVRR